ncbi:hypothetical protein Lsed01_00840 [Demequina sediminis]|uniref:Uncharacterized protein n=1 Tax=Demequina sediminis TaxID=1930058 RepID=A0ABP9WHG0_9MICO|nr:hypothetical protein [Demequina sediminis]BDZ62505.1 hypothetical protein GCM10025873_22960 [Demequina sediminis]
MDKQAALDAIEGVHWASPAAYVEDSLFSDADISPEMHALVDVRTLTKMVDTGWASSDGSTALLRLSEGVLTALLRRDLAWFTHLHLRASMERLRARGYLVPGDADSGVWRLTALVLVEAQMVELEARGQHDGERPFGYFRAERGHEIIERMTTRTAPVQVRPRGDVEASGDTRTLARTAKAGGTRFVDLAGVVRNPLKPHRTQQRTGLGYGVNPYTMRGAGVEVQMKRSSR